MKTEGVLTAHQPENKEVVYPIVLVEIDGIKTHALLDTGAGSSYASTKLINLLNKKPKETATKRINMMLRSSTTNAVIYSATLGAVDGKFDMNIELTEVHKPHSITLIMRLCYVNTATSKESRLKTTIQDLKFQYT